MKIKLHLTLLIVLIALFNACKKSGSGETPAKKLKYLTQIISVNGTTTTFTDYTYDDKKRLKSINFGGGRTTNYAYSDDNLFSTENLYKNGTNISRVVTEFTYSDDKLQSTLAKRYDNDQLTFETITGFAYNGDQLTEIHHDDATITFYYYDNNNNIEKIFYHAPIDFSVTYQYDNKKNRNISTASAFKKIAIQLNMAYSANNIISETNSRPNGPGTTTHTYTYNSDGNVIVDVVENKTTSYFNNKFTYTYDSDGYLIGGISDKGSKFTNVYSTLE